MATKEFLERCLHLLCSRHFRAAIDAALSEGGGSSAATLLAKIHASPHMRLPPVCRRDGPGVTGTAARLLAGAAILQERSGSGRAELREVPGFCDGTAEETLHTCHFNALRRRTLCSGNEFRRPLPQAETPRSTRRPRGVEGGGNVKQRSRTWSQSHLGATTRRAQRAGPGGAWSTTSLLAAAELLLENGSRAVRREV